MSYLDMPCMYSKSKTGSERFIPVQKYFLIILWVGKLVIVSGCIETHHYELSVPISCFVFIFNYAHFEIKIRIGWVVSTKTGWCPNICHLFLCRRNGWLPLLGPIVWCWMEIIRADILALLSNDGLFVDTPSFPGLLRILVFFFLCVLF